ncbi:hypothetical protein SAMN05428949_6471 [Chitinophaga sp. YR627]|nr:hypothetical protein SAMN05428949_6471 [Chitinophaga sp. YR627]
MTKSEFLLRVPDIINDSEHGYGELEIVSNTKGAKGVCYRHKDNLASGGNYAASWDQLYIKIMEYLKNRGCV